MTPYNNKLRFSVNMNQEYNVTISAGNYNVRELLDQLYLEMNEVYDGSLSIQYDSITNHALFIVGVTDTFQVYRSGTTCDVLLGLTLDEEILSGVGYLESSKTMDLSGIRVVNLCTNLPSYSIETSSDTIATDVLASIPVSVPPHGLITY